MALPISAAAYGKHSCWVGDRSGPPKSIICLLPTWQSRSWIQSLEYKKKCPCSCSLTSEVSTVWICFWRSKLKVWHAVSAQWQEAGTLPNFLSIPSFYVVKRFMDFSVAGGFGDDFKTFFCLCFYLKCDALDLRVGEVNRWLWYAPLW